MNYPPYGPDAIKPAAAGHGSIRGGCVTRYAPAIKEAKQNRRMRLLLLNQTDQEFPGIDYHKKDLVQNAEVSYGVTGQHSFLINISRTNQVG